tara:strand:- start:1529 stop:2461 length:933 start_codon:yes stop_codon:yes gene_type:complete
MMIKKPKFWDKKLPNFFAYLLIPISKVVSLFNVLQKGENLKFSNIRIICVGNIYVGGTGKTPLTIKISQLLNKKNLKSTVVKKFYKEQKDEQLLISNKTNLISKKDRKNCIENAINKNFKYAIFDDGLQDKSIKYDLKICCFSSNNWIGNGLVIPAGPLREKINSLKNFDIVFLNGPNINNEHIKQEILKVNDNIEIFEGRYKSINLDQIDISQNYIAFSGIGNPESFSFTLKDNNLKILKHFSFPDHYDFKKSEIDNIKKYAIKNNSKIITTEKDYLRINKELRNEISYIAMDLEIINENKFLDLICWK